MNAPEVLTFATEQELQDYADSLNERGLTPDVAIIDSQGVSVLACVTAPGGDGWGFEYYTTGEDGFMHCCNCAECGPGCSFQNPDWTPDFPVYGLAPQRCNVSGGYGIGAGHECRCNRRADHSEPWGYDREHGCECGAMWNGDLS